MIENIANGIITGVGLASGVTSLASFVSGFSLEKDVDKIKKSLRTLEDIRRDISSNSDKEFILLNNISHGMDVFYTNNMKQQKNVINSILDLYQQQKHMLDRQQEIISESIHEMKEIASSIRFNVGSPVNIHSSFAGNLMNDPFAMGVHEFSNFDYQSFDDDKHLITPTMSPVIWKDMRGNQYMGKMNRNVMERYGFDVKSGVYTAKYDGYSFSPKYGMYLPEVFVR